MSPWPAPAPRSQGTPFRAATQEPSLLPEHSATTIRCRTLSHASLPSNSMSMINNPNIATATTSGATHTRLLQKRKTLPCPQQTQQLPQPLQQPRSDVESDPNSSMPPNSLRRRNSTSFKDISPKPPQVYHRYPLPQQHYHEQPPSQQQPPLQSKHFLIQQIIQLLVLLSIAFLVWDANSNVQLAAAKLAHYKQETLEADVRATQLYDLLHQLRSEFHDVSKSSAVLHNTRIIQQHIQNLTRQTNTMGQEVASLEGFLEETMAVTK